MRFRLAFVVSAMAVFASSSAFAAFKYAAWVPAWDPNALTSLQKNAGLLAEVNPPWYYLAADNTIGKKYNAENASMRAAATGALFIPTVQNNPTGSYDGNIVVNTLATPESREAQASALMQLAVSKGYDGLDIDYESVATSARANFTAFIQTLAAKMHSANKKLSVTVAAKTSDRETWTGAGFEDWAAIGAVADSVKIMAYDFSWSTSMPGPIAPLTWLDNVTTYAESAMPAKKVMIGLPWYGYDWVGANGRDATYASATQVALNNGVAIQHDANGEATYTYSNHTVYFQDATSYAKKLELLKSKHGSIGGITHWAAGQEDPAVWDLIRGVTTTPPTTTTPPPTTGGTTTPPPTTGGGSGSTPASPLVGDFTIVGPSSVQLKQGAAASADFRLTPINGFAAPADVTVLNTTALAVSAPAVLLSGATMQLRVAVPTAMPAGTYAITIRLTSGTLVHEQLVNVVVSANVPGRRRAAR